jgi:hypothetical protein
MNIHDPDAYSKLVAGMHWVYAQECISIHRVHLHLPKFREQLLTSGS